MEQRPLHAEPDGPSQQPGSQAASRDEARRALRTLARALHPDLHAHLDDESRQRLSGELARATALYHGFG
jgi:hypothetical protein